ncbi:UNVERIFIED_CONTAM: hypothetical protein FKN15_038307 [Acipenser sinensis]
MAAAAGAEAAARCLEESSDSEPEQEPGALQKLIRKVSTSGQIHSKSVIFDEVDLTDASVAESSTKNFNNSFTLGSKFLQAAYKDKLGKERHVTIYIAFRNIGFFVFNFPQRKLGGKLTL